MKVKFIFIDPEKQKAEIIECQNNEVENLAHQKVANFLDTFVCFIDDLKTEFYVFCDDNGINNSFVSATTSNGEPLLFGKLLICKLDSTGIMGLTDEDIDYIMHHLATEYLLINENDFKIIHTLLITEVTQTTV